MVPFTLLVLLSADKTGAKRSFKPAFRPCRAEYPCVFAKNLKNHPKSIEVRIRQILGILIASWFPHGLRPQRASMPFFLFTA